MADFIDKEENVGNQLENWKVIISSRERIGQDIVMFMLECAG